MSYLSARKNAGMTQAEAASRLDVSNAAVCYWETGKYSPRADLLISIAECYGCSVIELLTDNPEYPDNHRKRAKR